jgi:hypothetical protein
LSSSAEIHAAEGCGSILFSAVAVRLPRNFDPNSPATENSFREYPFALTAVMQTAGQTARSGGANWGWAVPSM